MQKKALGRGLDALIGGGFTAMVAVEPPHIPVAVRPLGTVVASVSDAGGGNAAGTAATTLHTSAKNGEGIEALVEAIGAHQNSLAGTGELTRRRERAARAEVIRLLQSRVTASILRALETARAQTILTDVAKRKLDPSGAVEKLAQEIFERKNRSSNHVTTKSHPRA